MVTDFAVQIPLWVVLPLLLHARLGGVEACVWVLTLLR